MSFTFTDIVRDFAYYGFTYTPLTAGQIDRLMKLKLSRDAIYTIGCDCACGWRFEEALDAYFRAQTVA